MSFHVEKCQNLMWYLKNCQKLLVKPFKRSFWHLSFIQLTKNSLTCKNCKVGDLNPTQNLTYLKGKYQKLDLLIDKSWKSNNVQWKCYHNLAVLRKTWKNYFPPRTELLNIKFYIFQSFYFHMTNLNIRQQRHWRGIGN